MRNRMKMSPKNLIEAFVVVVVVGLIVSSEIIAAMGLGSGGFAGMQNPRPQSAIYNHIGEQQSPMEQIIGQQQPQQSNIDQSDLDNDDDDYDDAPITPGSLTNQQGLAQATAELYNQAQYLSQQANGDPGASVQQVTIPNDLKPAASKHYHHKNGAKGWLDMGAWTGKKGAFGWYDKHPVGKGK